MTAPAVSAPYSSAYREAELHDTSHQDSRRLTPQDAAALVLKTPFQTSAELAAASGKDRWQMARRLPEAADQDNAVIKRGEARTCKVTGRKALTWWPAE